MNQIDKFKAQIKDVNNVFELNKLLMQVQTHKMSLSDVAKIVKIYERKKERLKKRMTDNSVPKA